MRNLIWLVLLISGLAFADGVKKSGFDVATSGGGTVPVGSIIMYAGATAPDGWLLAYGQSLSTTTYDKLYAAIGYTYGGSGGSFSMPDCRGRVMAGKDNMGGTAANRLTSGGSGVVGTTLGAVGGAETFTLTSTHIPAHTHSVSGTSSSDAHTHATVYAGTASNALDATNNKIYMRSCAGSSSCATTWIYTAYDHYALGGGTANPTTHGITSSDSHSHTYSSTSGSYGSSGAHNNQPPTIVTNCIIKY